MLGIDEYIDELIDTLKDTLKDTFGERLVYIGLKTYQKALVLFPHIPLKMKETM